MSNELQWVDTHAHLNDERFDGRIPEVLAEARNVGVNQILVIGVDRPSSLKAVDLAGANGELFAVVGLQPNSLMERDAADFSAIEELVDHPRVVAIGETGLDRYWDKTPFEVQMEFFTRHLDLAHAVKKPVVVHCREAEADVLTVLRTFADRTGEAIAGVMHSYTGRSEFVPELLKLGLHFSFAGMATFKKSNELRETAKLVPEARILVETDSPYLSPEPNRGKPNQPAWVVHTGKRLAAARGVSTEAFAAATTANAKRLFLLPVNETSP